jgi:hypothetical protein
MLRGFGSATVLHLGGNAIGASSETVRLTKADRRGGRGEEKIGQSSFPYFNEWAGKSQMYRRSRVEVFLLEKKKDKKRRNPKGGDGCGALEQVCGRNAKRCASIPDRRSSHGNWYAGRRRWDSGGRTLVLCRRHGWEDGENGWQDSHERYKTMGRAMRYAGRGPL